MRRFLAILVSSTVAGLLYVALEVEAVKTGYAIRQQEENKTLFLDRARALKYNIARLSAPQVLEKQLLARRIALESPKSWQTLMLPGAQDQGASTVARPLVQRTFLSRLFVGTAQAEAKESSGR